MSTSSSLSDQEQMMNPIGQVQEEIIRLLKKSSWFEDHGVELIEQNKQQLAFLIKRNLSSLNHVALIVGVDRLTNEKTALMCEITITCTERVLSNRSKEGFVTAIDVCQGAIQMLDGCIWHFISMEHTTEPNLDVLQATATFRGLVDRCFFSDQQCKVN